MAQDDTRNPTEDEAQNNQGMEDLTEFGTSLAFLFGAGFFVFCAKYLGPYPHLTLTALVKWACYILAIVRFIFFLGFWGVAMRNAPEMGRFFKAIWGGGERGWHYAGQTVVALIGGFAAHLLATFLFYLSDAVAWLGWLTYIAWGVQVVVVVLALFAAVLFAYACDAFFIRPILDTTSQGGNRFEVLVDGVRKRGTVLIPILIALITLYVEVFR